MAYIQCKSGGAETPTLLWTNPNPNSGFAAQTLNIDTSQYSCLLFKYNGLAGTDYNYTYYAIHPIVANITQALCGTFATAGPGNGARYSRTYRVSTGTIEFSIGNADGNRSNNASVPVEIYGIKQNLFNGII